MSLPKTTELFDLKHTILSSQLSETENPWEILVHLSEIIYEIGATLSRDEYECPSEGVWVHKTAKVFPSAYLGAPLIVCAGAEIRHCAFIRGSAVVGEKAVVGNSTELKNAILFDAVQVPHYNYVGDSILGYHAHLGAGVIASNFKNYSSTVNLIDGDKKINTGLRKLGALVGDYSDVGCNSVLFPGTILGRNCRVYPLTRVRGTIGENHIVKSPECITEMK